MSNKSLSSGSFFPLENWRTRMKTNTPSPMETRAGQRSEQWRCLGAVDTPAARCLPDLLPVTERRCRKTEDAVLSQLFSSFHIYNWVLLLNPSHFSDLCEDIKWGKQRHHFSLHLKNAVMDLTAPWVKAVVHTSKGHSFSPAWLSCNIHLTIRELWVQQNCDWHIKFIWKCIALQIQYFKSYTRTHKEKNQHQNHAFSTEMISADVRNNEQNAAQPFKRENKTYFCLLLMLSSVPCRLMATDALLLPPSIGSALLSASQGKPMATKKTTPKKSKTYYHNHHQKH